MKGDGLTYQPNTDDELKAEPPVFVSSRITYNSPTANSQRPPSHDGYYP